MKLCYKCKKRPAVVFIQGMGQNGEKVGEAGGLCLVCAKEMGIQPINDMLKNMNISDDEIEAMSEQFMGLMNPEDDGLELDGENDAFSLGGAQTFPFLNGIFGNMDKANMPKSDTEDKENESKDKKKEKKTKKRKFISQFCTDLTQKARNGELDVIIGREAELYRVIQILSRRTKNNPCLIGEPGVGKTAIAEGLALKIASGDAPAKLLDKEIMLLDLTGLVAGTQFRGQFESRIKGLIDEVKAEGNIILFIDEVHNLVGAGDSEGSMSAGNILKPALSRGEIQVIGATTFKEYSKYIEKDAALERRFQPVTVEEPSIEESVKMLSGIKGYYEGYHNVKISDEIIRGAVNLSERYINDRFLPDKAIDLLDEACACACLRNKAIDEMFLADKKITALTAELAELEADVEALDYERIATVKFELEKNREALEKIKPKASKNKVTTDDLARVIELWTGVPAAKVKQNNLEKLSGLENNIKKHIIGLDEAVEAVVLGVRRSSVQISSHRRPASFIFVGPTGVGKTELVKVLAKELFNTPDALIRLDMSEFMEKHAVSKLIGAPPGYVGYDEAGQLTEKVRRKPYSVILFDEIEKAHPEVFNLLLQILDDGHITDSQGRLIDFKNTIIIMTSNLGSDLLLNDKRNEVDELLHQTFKPEFLNRIDEIVYFNPLSRDVQYKIVDKMLNILNNRLKENYYSFEFTNELKKHIIDESYSFEFGARPIKRYIQSEIATVIARAIISGSVDTKHKYIVDYKDKIFIRQ